MRLLLIFVRWYIKPFVSIFHTPDLHWRSTRYDVKIKCACIAWIETDKAHSHTRTRANWLRRRHVTAAVRHTDHDDNCAVHNLRWQLIPSKAPATFTTTPWGTCRELLTTWLLTLRGFYRYSNGRKHHENRLHLCVSLFAACVAISRIWTRWIANCNNMWHFC